MVENKLSWPTNFIHPKNRNGAYSSVAEYEQVHLINALVALGKLDSHPQSHCRFPQELLSLLSRVLQLAHDELLFVGASLDVVPRRRVKPELPILRPRGLFAGVQSVFTHRNLDPTSMIVNRQRGEIMAMINFHNAGFFPTYTESVQGPFIETSHESFWNSNPNRPRLARSNTDHTQLEDNEDSSSASNSSNSRDVRRSHLRSHVSTAAGHGVQGHQDDPGLVQLPGSTIIVGLEDKKLLQLENEQCPSYSRRGDHPIPYPIINHYPSRGSTVTSRTVGYNEQPPASPTLPNTRWILPVGSSDEVKMDREDTVKNQRTSARWTRSFRTRSQHDRTTRVRTEVAPRPRSEGALSNRHRLPPRSSSRADAGMSRISGATVVASHSALGGGKVLIKDTASASFDPRSSSSPSSPLSPTTTDVMNEECGEGVLISRPSTVNAKGWTWFIGAYQEFEQMAAKKTVKNRQSANDPVSVYGSSSNSGTTFASTTTKSHSGPSVRPRPQSFPTTKDSELFENGHENQIMEALVNLSKTIQNMVVALEAGGIVLTPSQLMDAIALKKHDWAQERERRIAEIHAENDRKKKRSTVMTVTPEQKEGRGLKWTTRLSVGMKAKGSPDRNTILSLGRKSFLSSDNSSGSAAGSSGSGMSGRGEGGRGGGGLKSTFKKMVGKRPSLETVPMPMPMFSSYKPRRSSVDNILYSAPGKERDPLPSELPEHLFMSSEEQEQLKNTSPTSPTTMTGLRLRTSAPGSKGEEEFIVVPLASGLRLGSITCPDLPIYGISLSNEDRTKTMAQAVAEEMEKAEQEFWKELEGLCEPIETTITTPPSSSHRHHSYHHDPKGKGRKMDELVITTAACEEDQKSYPGIVLLNLEDFVHNLEIVERYVTKMEAQAAKHYASIAQGPRNSKMES